MTQDKRGTGPLVIDGKVWDGRHMTGRQLNEMLKGRSPWDESIQRATAEYLGRSTTGIYSKSSTPAPVAPLALRACSVREVIPQTSWKCGRESHYTDAFTDHLARELGLKSKPRLRWFTEVVEGTKSEPGWTGIAMPASYTTLSGWFAPDTREIWIKSGLSYQREKQVLAHEYRHCWQLDTYGVGYMDMYREAAETDADTFAAKHR